MDVSDSKMEHVLVFGLLCCMALYLAKTLFSFRSSGLSVTRGPDMEEDQLAPVDEDDVGTAADHSD